MLMTLLLSMLLTTPALPASTPEAAPLSVAAAAAPAAAPPAAPAAAGQSGAVLTIYSSADPAGFDPREYVEQARAGGNNMYAWQVPGFGVVRETRTLPLSKQPDGSMIAQFTDVAEFIDPTTVSFTDLTDATTVVRNQAFQFDLVNAEKLTQKYLGLPITVSVNEGMQARAFTGTLLSANGGQIVLQTKEGVRILPAYQARIELSNLPGGLLLKPTLVWNLSAKDAGQHMVQLAYQTAGLTWRADYNLVVNGDDTKADLGAWVTLLNLSGAGWSNAGLKLVAGSVHRVQPQRLIEGYTMLAGRGGVAKDAQGFEEKGFFEYHLYTLPRKTDVASNSSQQLVLFPTATDAPVEKVLIMHGTPDFGGWGAPMSDRAFGAGEKVQVQVFMRLVNSKENHLGMPLPAGKVRVYKADSDGSLEFLGEDVIQHTPRDEKVMVKVGDAFDVVGERIQSDFTVDTGRREMTESITLKIRNRKEAPAKVIVRENLYRWSGWEITAKSMDFNKVNSNTIEFPVSLAAGAEATVTYTVRYHW